MHCLALASGSTNQRAHLQHEIAYGPVEDRVVVVPHLAQRQEVLARAWRDVSVQLQVQVTQATKAEQDSPTMCSDATHSVRIDSSQCAGRVVDYQHSIWLPRTPHAHLSRARIAAPQATGILHRAM
jgi:hypothetical protein